SHSSPLAPSSHHTRRARQRPALPPSAYSSLFPETAAPSAPPICQAPTEDRLRLALLPTTFFFQAEDGIRARNVTGVQTCALPILAEAADAAGVDLYYEAAVAAAIPVVGMLRRSLAGDHIQRISGIVNGTTNFILDAMESTGATYDDALADATRLGYAEADPAADV